MDASSGHLGMEYGIGHGSDGRLPAVKVAIRCREGCLVSSDDGMCSSARQELITRREPCTGPCVAPQYSSTYLPIKLWSNRGTH